MSKQGADDQPVSCAKCKHYYITWDMKFPYGCRAIHFKSKRSPHLDVLESSGHSCEMFTIRQKDYPTN